MLFLLHGLHSQPIPASSLTPVLWNFKICNHIFFLNNKKNIIEYGETVVIQADPFFFSPYYFLMILSQKFINIYK